ncbi:MAG: beta-eliminating lyase-related protein [Actinomycetota bacterium]
MLPAPVHSFASDNTAGVAPAVLEAMAAANAGPAIAYGADPVTQRLQSQVHDLFGPDATALLCWGGTGANIVGLSTLVRPHQGVICPASAHINVDECGGVERFVGSKLLDVPTPDGKLRPHDIEGQVWALGDVHHVQPGAISVTQTTEQGTLYTVEELRAVCDTARRYDMRIHMDGARLANAAAALDVPVREFTADLGVDVLSFGGTKNGIAYGEAVVFFDPELVQLGRFNQKAAAQLPSKMRFVAAQFSALLEDDRWLEHGRHANEMARRLAKAAGEIPGVEITQDVAANAVFAKLPRENVERLQTWSPFYTWAAAPPGAEPIDEVRWMTSFETTEESVDRFAAGIAAEMTGT